MTADDEFERRVRTVLEESADGLDGRVRSRLTRARHAALEARRAAPAVAWRNWAPAGAIAASALIAVVMLSQRGGVSPTLGPLAPVAAESQPALDDLELLADNDATELADADDYDFYEWAAAEGAAGGEELGS